MHISHLAHKSSLVSASQVSLLIVFCCWCTRQAAAPKLLSPATDQNSTIARRADGLYEFLKGGPSCQKPTAPKPCVPYTWGSDFGTEPGAVSSHQPTRTTGLSGWSWL